MYGMNNGYSFWDSLKITINSVTKIISVFKDVSVSKNKLNEHVSTEQIRVSVD